MIEFMEVYSTEFQTPNEGLKYKSACVPAASGRCSPVTLSVVGWIGTDKVCRGLMVDNTRITGAKMIKLKLWIETLINILTLEGFERFWRLYIFWVLLKLRRLDQFRKETLGNFMYNEKYDRIYESILCWRFITHWLRVQRIIIWNS